jgi:hypothetical protein
MSVHVCAHNTRPCAYLHVYSCFHTYLMRSGTGVVWHDDMDACLDANMNQEAVIRDTHTYKQTKCVCVRKFEVIYMQTQKL